MKITPLIQSQYKMKIIKDLGTIYPNSNSKEKVRFAIFECSKCKKNFKSRAFDARRHNQELCDICSRSKRATVHGFNNTRIHNIYGGIKSRANSKMGYENVSIFDEWKNDFLSFYNWAIENGYKENLTIDRIDVNGDYKPSNCRWVDILTQNQNKRVLMKTNTSGYRGVVWSNDRNRWRASIQVNKKRKTLKSSKCRLECAYAYDEYVLSNNLEHPTNFPH